MVSSLDRIILRYGECMQSTGPSDTAMSTALSRATPLVLDGEPEVFKVSESERAALITELLDNCWR